jgi:hypothetical protein
MPATFDATNGHLSIPDFKVQIDDNREYHFQTDMVLLATSPPSFMVSRIIQTGDIVGRPHDTQPRAQGMVAIDGVGEYSFDPARIQTVRPDLFQPGYFSLFDVVVYLSNNGKISLAYHFDEEMDTHVIDALNGRTNWWYEVWYDGGWPERSVHRMDYYPVKDKMSITFFRDNPGSVEQRYEVWRTEVIRRKRNKGRIVIPSVQITKGGTFVLNFDNVEVRPHNLRNDALKEGTITALDIIVSLAERGDLSYQLLWTEAIGSADIRNYYVECINSSCHRGMCGFVYEVGEEGGAGGRGNHIHLQTDLRILHSPEYASFFWIELGPCID